MQKISEKIIRWLATTRLLIFPRRIIVRKAFDDFFKDKPEPIIEMSGLQCLIVKL